MSRTVDVVVLEGDQTGQELLQEALRVLAPEQSERLCVSSPSTSASKTAGGRKIGLSLRRRRP